VSSSNHKQTDVSDCPFVVFICSSNVVSVLIQLTNQVQMTPEPMLWFTGELVDCTASSANISEEDSNVVDTEDDDSQCCCPDTVQEPPPFIHDCRFLSHTSTAMPCAAEKLQASSTSRTTVS